jgi:hypothetical protein
MVKGWICHGGIPLIHPWAFEQMHLIQLADFSVAFLLIVPPFLRIFRPGYRSAKRSCITASTNS